MSLTPDYKTITFPTQDEVVSIIVALEREIAHLDLVSGGDYAGWPNGRVMRDNAQAALVRMKGGAL